ncbi:DUF2892 domain-containing protein [Hydrogenovibrio sp. SC-1]|uniref:YgaP family membrane protein n=1 Tax=Hydrogenovibrio sp. SC-1 TaxID=2065820 RepID=UPI000C7AD846|nr:DUF2892 domain-containing protein [Hydrogenovibrio sp. SC-1]PLA75060.1 DUF2892 domain-containing protein [Hydrogenovibrio sp. SC-1]
MNVGSLDRWLRIIIGALLITLAATNTLDAWAYIGVVPLFTGLLKWCPLYSLLGIQTCPLHEQVQR